jgi:hypothetical protein
LSGVKGALGSPDEKVKLSPVEAIRESIEKHGKGVSPEEQEVRPKTGFSTHL